MKKEIGLYLVIIFLFCACNHKQNLNNSNVEILNIESAIKIDSAIIKNPFFEVVKLETIGESLLSNVQKAFVDDENDRVFVLSDFNLFIFHVSGKFITKLKIGRGPGEISRLSSFSVNSKLKQICVLDNSQYLCEYDYSGNFIKKSTLSDFFSFDLFYKSNDSYFLSSNYVGKSEKNFVSVFNTEKEQVVDKMVSLEFSSYPTSSNIILPFNFFRKNKDVYYISADIFTLFHFDNETFNPIYKFEVGDKKVPKNLAKDLLLNSKHLFREQVKEKGFIPHLLYVVFFNDYCFFGLDDEKYSCFSFDINQPKKLFVKTSIASYFGLPEVNSFRLPVGYYDNSLLFIGYPSSFFEEESSELTKSVKIGNISVDVNINENPFVLRIK